MAIPENALFSRSHELIIGQKVITTGSPIEPPDARLFRNRIKFRVEKTTVPQPYKAKISLYNISQESRNFLEEEDLIVFLKAGYNEESKNIFTGEIRRRESSRSGPDVILTLECGDSEKIMQTAHIEISLSKGATNILLFQLAAEKLGLSSGVNLGITQITFRKSFHFSGLVKDLLNEQTKNINVEWNIQNGELRILPKEKTDTQEAVLIDSSSGLIGFPTKTKEGLKFDSLLNNELWPGRAIKVVSKQYQGQFGPASSFEAQTPLIDSGDVVKARRVIHEGDTKEGKWTSSVEAIIPRSGAI